MQHNIIVLHLVVFSCKRETLRLSILYRHKNCILHRQFGFTVLGLRNGAYFEGMSLESYYELTLQLQVVSQARIPSDTLLETNHAAKKTFIKPKPYVTSTKVTLSLAQGASQPSPRETSQRRTCSQQA